jgi:hypothetical protein
VHQNHKFQPHSVIPDLIQAPRLDFRNKTSPVLQYDQVQYSMSVEWIICTSRRIHECSPPCRTFMDPISKTSAGTFGFSELLLYNSTIRFLIANTDHGAFRARGQDGDLRRIVVRTTNDNIPTFQLQNRHGQQEPRANPPFSQRSCHVTESMCSATFGGSHKPASPSPRISNVDSRASRLAFIK